MEDTIRLKLRVHRTAAASGSSQADDAEIRRLCLSRAEGFDGLARACAAWCGCGFALRYTDDEGDVVELQSQEEWAECLHLYDCGPRQPRPLLLSLEALPSSSSAKKGKKNGDGKRRAVKLRFVNSTAFNVQVSWLRQNRPRVLYTSIAPQGVLCVNTFAGHVWGYAAPAAGIDGRVTVSRFAAEAEVVVALPQCAEPPPPLLPPLVQPPPPSSSSEEEEEEEKAEAEAVYEDVYNGEEEEGGAVAVEAEEEEVKLEAEGAAAEEVEARMLEEARRAAEAFIEAELARREAAEVARVAAEEAEAEAARAAEAADRDAAEEADRDAAEEADRDAAEAAAAETRDDLFRAFEASQAVTVLKEVRVGGSWILVLVD